MCCTPQEWSNETLVACPLVSLALLLLWLMLNQPSAHILLGALITVAIPLMVAPAPDTGTGVPSMAVIRLTVYSLIEILLMLQRSTLILFSGDRLSTQFIRIPLDLKDPHGLAVLACIINSTPGTVC